MKIILVALFCAFDIGSITAAFTYISWAKIINIPYAVYNKPAGWTRITAAPFPFGPEFGSSTSGVVGPSSIPDLNQPVTGLDANGNYCNLPSCGTKKHVACSSNLPNIANCKKAAIAPLTDALKSHILTTFNDFRSELLKGTLTGAGGQKLPAASSMPPMTWSPELKAFADLENKNCDINTDLCSHTKTFINANKLKYQMGSSGLAPVPETCFTKAFEYWKSGIQYATPNDIKNCCSAGPAFNFYALINAGASQIGCSLIYFSSETAEKNIVQMCLVTCDISVGLVGGQALYSVNTSPPIASQPPASKPGSSSSIKGLDPNVDYCNVKCNGINHVACSKNPPNTANCVNSRKVEMTNELKNNVLNLYNGLRRDLYQQKLTGLNGVKLPIPKTPMVLAEWHSELEAFTELDNSICDGNSRPCLNTNAFPRVSNIKSKIGANGIELSPQVCIEEAFKNWKQGMAHATVADINKCCKSTNAFSFYFLILPKTSKIGCSIIYYTTGTVRWCQVACTFNDSVLENQPIY